MKSFKIGPMLGGPLYVFHIQYFYLTYCRVYFKHILRVNNLM
jgi:hypothetical protein